ncbi:hypothetical protein AVEN_249732-1 [Araneus ventricosus]|uniref:PiggyBac transposable element-derived protein domain-containing protein n=1 Tax=Araneus ventricosus TaxID=182803 RepID=A0A4Y2C7P7_ARAVE|nr:hypothetical protein AVEN_249732-1 [Araneus ventricosus]
MPRKRYLTLEEAIQRLFEDDTDGDEQTDIDIVVLSPETVEASDEEERNDNILNHDNDDFPCDTAGEIEVHSKKSLSPLKGVVVMRKNVKSQKLNT